MQRALLAFLAIWPASVAARPVFFDDFEGSALLPHWIQPPASHWQHDVSNGMLNVTGLFYPSLPQTGVNFALMTATFAPQTDFKMDVWMGWEPGALPHELIISAVTPANGILATFGYENWGPGPIILASASGGGFEQRPAPAPGIHQFSIERVGAQFIFELNGEPFLTTAGLSQPVAAVVFQFTGPYPGALGPLHIDRVQIVPSPATLWIPALSALSCLRRTRPTRA